MSIYNINSIENKLNLLNSSYTDEYILQSVANLGQRLSVKGDSITTNYFLFSDLFLSGINYSQDEYIGKIYSNDNNIFFNVLSKNNLSIVESISIPYTNNIIEGKQNEKLELNNVLYYNYLIKSNLLSYNVKLVTKKDNYVDSILFFDVNKYTNIISEAIIFKYITDIKNNNTSDIVVYYVIYDQIKNIYNINIYLADSSKVIDLDNVLSNHIDNLHVFSSASNKQSFTVNSIFNEYINSSNLLFKHLKYDNNKTYTTTIDFSNNYFSISNEITNILGIYSLKNDINIFNEIQNIIYPNIKQYFSNSLYLDNINILHKNLIVELYKAICSYANNDVVYFPIDFKLNYYCNSNNLFEIYGNVSDITVKFVNNELNVSTIKSLYDNNTILCSNFGQDKTILFNYDIIYDNTANNVNKIINSINVYKKYTAPYVNGDNLWVINDVTTEINAKGYDAGNPNIIIVYNKSKDINDFEILAGARKQELLTKISWKLSNTFIQSSIIENKLILEDHLDTVYCWIPSLENTDSNKIIELVNLLKYSIIISISSYNCIDQSPYSSSLYNNNSIITTFWVFDDITNRFNVLENKKSNFDNSNISTALDLVTLSNINDYTKYYINNVAVKSPDKYTHNWLVFDRSYVTLKNETLSNIRKIYGTIANYKAAYITSESVQYDNDFNLIIKYTDSVEGAELNDITGISFTEQNYKYINTIKDDFVYVSSTNRLYSYKDAGNNIKNRYEFIPNSNVPLFNLKEIFLQNVNALNRVNVLSIDNNSDIGYIYNAYFGTSFDEFDKYRLHIGTTSTNINVGNDTLMSKDHIDKFKKHTYFDIDIEHVNINGKLNITQDLTTYNPVNIYDNIWNIKEPNNKIKDNNGVLDKYKVYNLIYKPISKYMLINDTKDEFLSYITNIQLNNTSYLDNAFSYGTNTSNTNKKFPVIEEQLINYYNYAMWASNKYNNMVGGVDIDSLKLWIPLFYVIPYDEEKYKMDLANGASNDLLKGTNMFHKVEINNLTNGATNQELSQAFIKNSYISKVIDYTDDDYIDYLKSIRKQTENNEINTNVIYNIYYVGDGLYIPSLLYKLGLTNWNPQDVEQNNLTHNTKRIVINSKNNIVYLNGYPLFMHTSNYFLKNQMEYKKVMHTDLTSSIIYKTEDKLYIGEDLSITYYIEDNVLYLTINEHSPNDSISLPYVINYNYNTSYTFIKP